MGWGFKHVSPTWNSIFSFLCWLLFLLIFYISLTPNNFLELWLNASKARSQSLLKFATLHFFTFFLISFRLGNFQRTSCLHWVLFAFSVTNSHFEALQRTLNALKLKQTLPSRQAFRRTLRHHNEMAKRSEHAWVLARGERMKDEWMGSEKSELFWTLPDLHEIYSFKNNNTFVLNYKSK